MKSATDGEALSERPRFTWNEFSGSLGDLAPHDYYIGTGDPLVERWDYRLRGVIDEVFLFDRALTAGEIAALAIDPVPLEILVDGFESGDTTSWSVTTP